MPHPLHGYALAKAERHRFVIVKTDADGTKTFYAGFGRYDTERDAAIRFSDTRATLAPGCRYELA